MVDLDIPQNSASSDYRGEVHKLNDYWIDIARILIPGALIATLSAIKQCYLRHIATNTIVRTSPNPHRPFSEAEIIQRELLIAYLNDASEDELIEEVLLPLFRHLGFHRVTSAGHKDKALEYGKDVWMRFTLPTQHVLYFGIQANPHYS